MHNVIIEISQPSYRYIRQDQATDAAEKVFEFMNEPSTLASYGTDAVEASLSTMTDLLINTYEDGNRDVKSFVLNIFRHFLDHKIPEDIRAKMSTVIAGAPDDSDPSVLIESFRTADASVQMQSAGELVELGPAAVPALIEALGDDDAEVRMWSQDALVSIGSAAVPALNEASNNPAMQGLTGAAWVLGHMGTAAQAARTQ